MHMQQNVPLLHTDTPCYRYKNMAKLNISQSARAVGVARITIQRYMAKGKLHWEANGAGKKVIDTAELLRVFGELKSDGDTPNTMKQRSGKIQQDTPEKVLLLEEKVTSLEERITELKQDKEDLKRDKGLFQVRETELIDIIKHQTRLLPVPQPQEPTLLPQEAVNQPNAISEPKSSTVDNDSQPDNEADQKKENKTKNVSKNIPKPKKKRGDDEQIGETTPKRSNQTPKNKQGKKPTAKTKDKPRAEIVNYSEREPETKENRQPKKPSRWKRFWG